MELKHVMPQTVPPTASEIAVLAFQKVVFSMSISRMFLYLGPVVALVFTIFALEQHTISVYLPYVSIEFASIDIGITTFSTIKTFSFPMYPPHVKIE